MRWFPFSSFHVPAIALHLSDHAIAVLRLDIHKEVISFARTPLPRGIMEEGRVIDRVKLAAHIRTMCSSATPKPIHLKEEVPVVFSIPESQSFTHIFSVPTGQPKEKLLESVLSKASRLIPIDLSLLYCDWHIVEENLGGTDRIFFAAAPREIVDAYIATCELSNLLPLAIDMETISLAHALLPDEKTPTLIVDIGERTTSLGFFDDAYRLGLAVSIPIAGRDFNAALVERLHIEQDEAERLKREEGMDRRIPDNRVMIIVQERLQAILQQINKALIYFETTYRKPVKHIFFAGASSLMPDLVTYFAMNMHGEIMLGDPLKRIGKGGAALLDGDSAIMHAPLIGLALRALRPEVPTADINLLHGWEGERWEERERKILARWQKLALPLFAASVILALYVFYSYVYAPYVRLKEESTSRVSLQSFVSLEGASTSTTTLPSIVVPVASTSASELKSSPQSTSTENGDSSVMVIVKDTPTGWLNVRQGPGVTFPVRAKIYPGESYLLIERKDEWAHISHGNEELGWVSSNYIELP